MQKFLRNLLLAALMFVPLATNAQNTLTVADGTATNDYVPVYGYYADAYLRCQYIYPAADIALATTTVGMNGGSITGMTFYASESSVSLTATFNVMMMEVSSTTLSAFEDMTNATLVYTGTVNVINNEMVVTFDNPYTYNGGNLLVEFASATTGNFSSTTFYGVNSNGSSVQGYNYSSVSGVSPTQRNFIPKTTFTFTGGQAVTCPAVQSFSITATDSNSISLVWVDSMNTGASYSIDYWAAGSTDTLNTVESGNTAEISGLNANTVYHFKITTICSATDQSVSIYTQGRTACGVITLPYIVDFEDAAGNGAWYPCWDSIIHAGTDPSVNDENSPANHTPNGIYAMYLQSNSSENYNLVVSPAVPLPGDQIFVSFWARKNNNAWLKAGVMTNPHDTTTFIPMVEVEGNSWNEYTFSTSNLDATATYYVAWLGYRNNGFIGKFDDVTIREDLGCNKPSMAVIDSVGPYHADLRWTNGGTAATAYDIFYNTTNDMSTAMVEEGVSDTVFALVNLLPQTTYYCWVRTACGSDSADAKAFPSFTTQLTCAPVVNAAMGNISYTAAQVSWAYDTTQGFESVGAELIVVDNTDSEIDPVVVEVYGNSYTIEDLLPGHGYTVTIRNMCQAPDQTDTAAGVNVSFMTTSCSEIVSDGSTNQYIPTHSYYGNTFSQMIYLASEMPSIDSIHGIAFNITSRNSGNNANRPFDVYVNLIDTNAFNGTNYVIVDSSSMYAAGFMFNTGITGWQVIPFDSTFVYDGTSNLLVTINDRTGAYGSAATFASISAPGRGLHSYRDGATSQYDPATMTTGTANSNIPAVRFVAECEVPQCFAPMLTLDSVDANSVSVNWVSTGTESSWIVGIKAYGDNAYTYEANPVTDTFYTFSNLNGSTLYEVIVGSLCEEGDTLYASIQATTPCAGTTCDITIAAQDSYGDGWNNGTLHFYQNGASVGSYSMPSQGQYSTVVYDTATVSVCSGIPVTFNWSVGSFDAEVSYVIYDGGFTEVYNSATSGVNYSGTIDDACPTCMRPTGLMASAIDSADLEFVWDLADTVNGYIVSFNGGAWESANNGAYNVSALTPNTEYTFSVMAICQPGDTSSANTITVRTSCGQMVLPYTNSFEADATGAVPSCWTVVTPGYNGFPAVSNGGANTGSNYLALGANYTSSTTIATSLVPLNGDQIYVSFWASVNQGNTLFAGVMTDLAYDTTFIPLLTIPANNGYTRYEFNTSTLNSYEQYYVAFRLVTGAGNHYADLDDIEIRLDEGCMYPANLIANPGAHNVDLVWSNNNSTPNYVVQYHQSGNNTWVEAGTTIDTSYSVTGLNAATSYDFRVGFICNADTLWSTISAQTTCDVVNLPYYENFDSPTGTLPPCWDYTNPSYFHWNRWTTHAETSGDGELMVGSGSAGEYAILPEFNSSITKIQISFKAKLGNISEGDSVLFGVYDSYSNTVTQAGAMAIAGQSRENFVVFTYAYTNYSGSGSRIAIGHSHNNPSDWGMAVDSIVVIQLPDCLPPTDVEAHNTMYPNTADDVYFTWTGNPYASSYQIYIDTITSTAVVDSVPDSLLVSVDTNYYHVPFNSLAYGAHYRFFVRSNCGYEYGEWVELQNGFATDEVWMGNGTVDTVIGCDFIIYDNGGPVAGYLHNSNSTLVMMSGEEGRELQVQGGWFSHGADANTFTIYDGVGTSGDVLYQRNQTNLTESVDTILATSTTGALTITFTSGYYAALGYELYVHCVGAAPCQRPVRLHAVMTDAGEASLDWEGTANSYKLYYKLSGATTWDSMVVNANNTTLTGLTADTNYDFYVVADCDSNGLSTPSVTVQFNTHFEVVITPCDPVTDLAVNNVTTNSADLSWTSTASSWEIELSHLNTVENLTASATPYTLTNLLPNMQYSVRVRSLCNGQNEEPSSEWSTSVSFTTAGGTTPTFTITVQSNNEAWGTVTGGGTYNENSTATLTATANDGYRFVQWNDANTDNPRSVTVTANATYIATFEAIPTYTITVTANDPNMGTVTGGGTYLEGTEVTLTATPNDGYLFIQWNDAVTTPTRTITVTANANYVATFADTSAELVYHTVSVNVNDEAMGTVTGDGIYLEGTEATLTAIANAGYRFVEWNDHNTDNPRNVVVNEDMSFTATFEAIPTYTITAVSNNDAWGTVTGGGNYQEGTVITLIATANDGYHFVRWNDDVTTATRQVVVNANETYTAYFEADAGIDDVVSGTMSLYPNPATISVTLTVDGFEGMVNVELVDMNGRVVYTANSLTSAMTIDVSNLAKGAYFVRVTGERQTAVRKLIVK